MRRMRVLVPGATAIVFAVLAGTAWGGEAPTTVKITDQVDVAGKVQSSDSDCRADRKVVLLKKKPGKDAKQGTDTTDGAGRFSFGNPGLSPGRYYVKAKRVAGMCAGAKSDTFRVSGPG